MPAAIPPATRPADRPITRRSTARARLALTALGALTTLSAASLAGCSSGPGSEVGAGAPAPAGGEVATTADPTENATTAPAAEAAPGQPLGRAAEPGTGTDEAAGGEPSAENRPFDEDAPGATLPSSAKSGIAPPGSEPVNQLGQPVRLDETASLACAHAEFAQEALDDGDVHEARAEAVEVKRWGAASANATLAEAAALLADRFEPATAKAHVKGFLEVCADNGHL